MPAHNRQHYSGDFQRRARLVRNQANADPTTRCWRSGLTLAQGQALWGNNVRWQAGHLIPGDPSSPLAPELSHINMSEGATRGNQQRQPTVGVPPSHTW